jgi:hypothetical protein
LFQFVRNLRWLRNGQAETDAGLMSAFQPQTAGIARIIFNALPQEYAFDKSSPSPPPA